MSKTKKSVAQIWSHYESDVEFLLFVREEFGEIVHQISGIRSQADLEKTVKRVERDEEKKQKLLAKIDEIENGTVEYLEKFRDSDKSKAKLVKEFLQLQRPGILAKWERLD